MSFNNETSVRKLTARIDVGVRTFEFPLYARPLQLGQDCAINYYWMDTSTIRRPAKRLEPGGLAESILAFRYAVLEVHGMQRDHEELANYVWAKFYPLVASSKTLQDIYLDAFLKSGSTIPEDFEVDDETRLRIRKIAADRDSASVRTELDRLFERFQPEADDKPGFQKACHHWLGNGVQSLLEKGQDGLENHLQEVVGWMARYRRKGGDDRVRHFVNMFSYESKASFNFCYANVWIGIIDWLNKNDGLDIASERFLGFWHNYHADPDSPFQGQVLALHPLSGFFMKDPSACWVAGRFFGTDSYADVYERGAVGSSAPYWDLIGSILTAGHQYRRARDGQIRSPKTLDECAESALAGIVAAHPEKCTACGTVTEFQSVGKGDPDTGVVPITCKCPNCGAQSVRNFTEGQIKEWFAKR